MANTKKKSNVKKEEKETKKVAAKKTSSTKAATKKSTAKKVDNKKALEKKTLNEAKEEKKIEEVSKNHNAVIRNVIIAVLIVVLLIVLFVLNSNSSKKYKDTSSTGNTSSQTTSGVSEEASKISDDEKGDLTNVSIDEYLSLLKGDKYAIIYIGRPTCAHCQNQEPIMRYMVYKYNLTINYLNTDELDNDGQNKLQKSNEYFETGWGTPLILVVKDNEIVDKFEGETSIEDLTNMFKKYDLIKE